MVPAALGDDFTEEELAVHLGSYEFGTPASRVIRLRGWGYHVEFGPATTEGRRAQVSEGRHPVIFVRADFLPWADYGGFHALVVGGVTETAAYVHDPALAEGPTPLPKDALLLAWEEFDHLTAVISK
jgi:hypothetical protein